MKSNDKDITMRVRLTLFIMFGITCPLPIYSMLRLPLKSIGRASSSMSMNTVPYRLIITSMKSVPKVLVTGFPDGRLHPYVKEAFQCGGYITFDSSDMPTESSSIDITNFLEANKVDCVVNLAALWKGSHQDIWDLNYEYATKLARASHESNVTFIQASTICALEKVDYQNHPYAFSKKNVNKLISPLPNVIICHLGPLLGDNSSPQSDISFLAGIRRILPYTMHLDGKQQMIQPTSYAAAAACFYTLAFLRQNNVQIPKELNIVGDPIAMSTFLRAVNPYALFEIHIKTPDDLLRLAARVQNGIMVPEFIKLAQQTQEADDKILDNTEYKKLLLGRFPIPTPLELAKLVGQKSSIKQWIMHVIDIITKRDLMVFVEAAKLLPKIKLQFPPKSE